MQIPLLQASQLTKHYYTHASWFRKKKVGKKAVNGISFSIPKQGIVGLIGESGSGKTTLALGLAGLLRMSSGLLSINSTSIDLRAKYSTEWLSSQVRMVFQNPKASLNPRKTVLDTLGHLLLHQRLASKNRLISAAASALELVGLSTELFHRYPHQLSGGQQQRISIARALLGAPKLIVCDEVTSSLDLSIQAQILQMLASVQKQMQLSYLFISHDLPVVRSFCSELLIMYRGEIVEAGPTDQIFRAPQHPYTQMLLHAQLPDRPRES